MPNRSANSMKSALSLEDNDFSGNRPFTAFFSRGLAVARKYSAVAPVAFTTSLKAFGKWLKESFADGAVYARCLSAAGGLKTILARIPSFRAAAFLSAGLVFAIPSGVYLGWHNPHQHAVHTVRASISPAARLAAENGRQYADVPSAAASLQKLAALENPQALDAAEWRFSGKLIPVAYADKVPSREQEPVFFVWSDEIAPGPPASLLGLQGGKPVLRTMTGAQVLPQLTDIALSGPSMPYEAGTMLRIATGEQSVETLLGEFRSSPDFMRGQFFVVHADASSSRQEGGYADDLFTLESISYGVMGASYQQAAGHSGAAFPGGGAQGGQCRSDRVELASWLAQARRDSLSFNLTALERASKYSDYVERYSTDYALPPSLVYAIMRIESAFNPRAVSIANALGLMQVVPHSAGDEVHTYLTGKRGVPARELLFTPEHNIKYGTTYLYLLNNRHFKDVENHISRELCMIAAYNGGPNAVLRTFDRDKTKALGKINSLTPEQLYDALVRNLPSQETRDYVVKVVDARNKFRHSSMSF